jgi:GNAT superfamily N-acetyltransferase
MNPALPEPLRSFWYAMSELNEVCLRTRWGVVVSDARFPLVWDANHAAVLEALQDVTVEEIRTVLHPTLRRARAPFEHVEVWGATAAPVLGDFLREGAGRGPDIDMVLSGPPPDRDRRIAIQEVDDPDDRFLDWYRDSRVEFGGDLSAEVLDQLLSRDLIVFLPAGLRWFVAHIDGEPAGFASLISLAGVGYLDGVITMPPFRDRGIATATTGAAIEASLSGGDRLVHLLAEEQGRPRQLYERLGFRPWGIVQSFTRRLPHSA